MAASIETSTTNFDKLLVEMINKKVLEELRAPLPFLLPGNFVAAKYARGTNNTMRFVRVADMDVTTGTPTPGQAPWLTEGEPPDPEDLDLGYEEFQAAQAGRVIRLTDVAMEEDPFDLLDKAAEKVAYNAIATADKRVADVVLAGTNVLYAGSGNTNTSQVAAGDVVDGVLLKRARATLAADNVPTFGDGYYRAIVHPGVVFDIESDDAVGGWIDANRYGGSMALFSGEIGRFAGIRFIESTNAGVKAGEGTSSIDVYSTFVFGPQAYAFGDWGTIETHLTPPGGHDDPLHQSALVGWKSRFGAILFGESGNGNNESEPRYVRIESASGL